MPNKNENATVLKIKKFSKLNNAYVCVCTISAVVHTNVLIAYLTASARPWSSAAQVLSASIAGSASYRPKDHLSIFGLQARIQPQKGGLFSHWYFPWSMKPRWSREEFNRCMMHEEACGRLAR